MIHESQCWLLRSLKSWLLLLLSGNLTVCHGQSRKFFWGKSSTSELFSMANCKSLEGKFRKISHDYFPIHSYPYQILNHIKPYIPPFLLSKISMCFWNPHFWWRNTMLGLRLDIGVTLPPVGASLNHWWPCSEAGTWTRYVDHPQNKFSKGISPRIFRDFSIAQKNIWIWLVVWNHGILWLSIQLGISSSQVTFTPSFFRGVAKNHQPAIETS